MAEEVAKLQKIGNFIVLDKIGKGGMGAVYKAEDPSLHRTVALKLLPAALAEDAEFVARFKYEATAAAQLSHSHLVQVYAAGEDAGLHYIAMEFVDGESLRQRMDRHDRLPPVEALAIASYVSEALRYAWNKAKIIHRDIKPDNILLSKDGEVKVADLGLAKSLQKASVTLTTAGMVMGSPFYISPEQAQGKKDLDFRTDIYSLGCTLFHMLTGQPPFPDEELGTLFYKHIHEAPPDILKLCPDCPPKVAQLVKRMMSKDPKQRQPTYEALLADLQTLYRTLKNAPAQKVAAAATQQRRTMVWIYGGAAAVLVLVAGVFVWNGMKVGRAVPSAPSSGSNLVTQSAPAATSAQPSATAIITPPRAVTRPTATAVDDAFIQEVAALPAEQKIARVMVKMKELNPGFDPTKAEVQHKVENGDITELSFFTFDTTNISPIRALTGLKRLSCGGKFDESTQVSKYSTLADLSPLQGLPLTEIQFQNSLVSNLAPLRGMPLTFVNCTSTRVTDLKPLKDMPLRRVYCGSTKIDDLAPLATAPLTHLLCSKSSVSNLAPLRGKQITRLACDGTLIVDLTPLVGMPLRTLICDAAVAQQPGNRAVLKNSILLQKINDVPVAEFWKQVDAEAKAPPATEAKTVAATKPEADWSKAINLMPLIDLSRDTVRGEWVFRQDALVGDSNNVATIETPYCPPEEYDYRIEFTVLRNGQGGAQHLAKDGHGFTWNFFGTATRAMFGFEAIRGKTMASNPSSTNLVPVEVGRRYVSLVEVRNKEVRAFLDGHLIAAHKTDYSDLQTWQGWRLRDETLLGVGCQTRVAFHSIRVREITGKGTFTRAAPVTNEDEGFAKQISALPASQQMALVLARLKELNPKFDAAKSSFKIEGGAVAELTFTTVGVTNLTPVRALPALKKLTIVPWNAKERGDLTSLAPLAGMQLTWLWCHNNPISDLKPLRDMPLANLSIAGTRVTDLGPLAGSKLSILSCGDTEISDLAPLEGVPLTILWMQNTKVSSLAPLMTMPLQELRCDFDLKRDAKYLRSIRTLTKINNSSTAAFWTFHHMPMPTFGPATTAKTSAPTSSLPAKQQIERFVDDMKSLNPRWDGDVEPVIEKRKIVELKFNTVGVTNISPLQGLRNLRELSCTGKGPTKLGDLEDLSPLRGLKLEKLSCRSNPIKDLNPLKGMPLKKLDCYFTQVNDLSPLAGMELTQIDLMHTTVADLTPLRGMPLVEVTCSAQNIADLSPLADAPLRNLFCSGTKVSDLSPLQGMRLIHLSVHTSQIRDLSVLRGMPLKSIACDFDPARDTEILGSIKTLEKINLVPVKEFWERVGARDIPKMPR